MFGHTRPDTVLRNWLSVNWLVWSLFRLDEDLLLAQLLAVLLWEAVLPLRLGVLGTFRVHGNSSGIIVWCVTREDRFVHSFSKPCNETSNITRSSMNQLIAKWLVLRGRAKINMWEFMSVVERYWSLQKVFDQTQWWLGRKQPLHPDLFIFHQYDVFTVMMKLCSILSFGFTWSPIRGPAVSIHQSQSDALLNWD